MDGLAERARAHVHQPHGKSHPVRFSEYVNSIEQDTAFARGMVHRRIKFKVCEAVLRAAPNVVHLVVLAG